MSEHKLDADSIPQADDPRTLIRLLTILVEDGTVDTDEFGLHPRQLLYYRSALRILGLLDASGHVTIDGQNLVDRPWEAQRDHLRASFVASKVGEAWVAWAAVAGLEAVDPTSATRFLSSCSDLTGATVERRGSTLRRWWEWMVAPNVAKTEQERLLTTTGTSTSGENAIRSGLQTDGLVHWRQWTYETWNQVLIEHYFRTPDPRLLHISVETIPSSPEELALAVGERPEAAEEVAKQFVDLIKAALPLRKVSFCGFCRPRGGWSPATEEPPHFFAMLLSTCLAAYGYPTAEGRFATRYETLLGKTENFQQPGEESCLPGLWEKFAAWTLRRNSTGDSIRALRLPPESPSRSVIGFSHFLAFPNRSDRNALARLLWAEGFVGFDPSIVPLLAAMQRNHKFFSKDFNEDLEEFIQSFNKGKDPRDSAFWRAVRQEALDPSSDGSGLRREREPRTALLFDAANDELFPVIACQVDYPLPEGYSLQRLEHQRSWDAVIVGPDEDREEPWRQAFGSGRFLGVGTWRLIKQGVLVLREPGGPFLEVVSGTEAQGCRDALVHESKRDAFVAAYGGRKTRAIRASVDGWYEVSDASIQVRDTLPPGLEDVIQLLPTMAPPAPSFRGGIRTGGDFLFVPSFLPTVHAPDVSKLTIQIGDTEYSLERQGSDQEWHLPAAVDRAGVFKLTYRWPVSYGPRPDTERVGETSVRFVQYNVNDAFKRKPAGSFYLESCPQAEVDVRSLGEVPVGITTPSREASADLLEMEATARYLGPGHGEMSLGRKVGHDWLVIGPKGSPELLVYVGDPRSPTLPSGQRSPLSANRRHWKLGFSNARRTLWRTEDRDYHQIDSAPLEVRSCLKFYKHNRVANDAPECSMTELETFTDSPPKTCEPDARTQEAVDILAAIASRRNSLHYQEVRDVFNALHCQQDHSLFQQILRGWVETGLLDMLRSAGVSRFSLVARRPRFVMVHRGPDVEATLIGLLTTVRRTLLMKAIQQEGVTMTKLGSGSPWQPATIRVRGPSAAIDRIRQRAELQSSEWLAWPAGQEVPAEFNVLTALRSLNKSIPMATFRTAAVWDWATLAFSRSSTSSNGIRLERRIHRDQSVIYVVLSGGEPVCWTYSRTWALLAAYEAQRQAAFVNDGEGGLWNRGRTPVHLPLPLGRLCALIGAGLPGPVQETSDPSVLTYRYPFGRRLFRLIERLLPPSWCRRPG